MEGVTAAARAAAVLVDDREALAREVGHRLYAEMPWLLEKYGERGREKCLQDMRYNLEHLAPAVELDDPAIFERYVLWVDWLLRSRSVDTAELARSLELVEETAGRRMDEEAREVLGRSIAAGLAALRAEAAG